MTFRVTRKSLLKTRRRYPWLYNACDELKVFDKLSPGWKVAKAHWIMGRPDSPDLVYELPKRVYVRGWDYTGAINGSAWVKKKSKSSKR